MAKKLKKVRLGIIGCGNIGRVHMSYMHEVSGCEFVAAADAFPAGLETVVDQYGVEGFDDGYKLIKSGLVDAILIATPHYFHPDLSIAGFKSDLHVLTEKPLAVTAYEAAKALKAHEKKKHLVYAAMFQTRKVPLWQKVKELVSTGQIGEVQRFNWIVTNWFRTQTYYDSAAWRATWKGEGGGVLLNQCPHNLDTICWVLGLPKMVHAHLSLGKYHHIEVEDEVTAYLEWPNGATGVFVTTTGEAPGTDRLEIAGDGGKIVVEDGQITMTRTRESVQQFCRTTEEAFGTPSTDKYNIEVTRDNPGHKIVTQNFINAIVRGEPLICPAADAIQGLELGNAMLMSGLIKEPVTIAKNRAPFDKKLKELVAKSKFKKGTVKKAKVDMAKSFH